MTPSPASFRERRAFAPASYLELCVALAAGTILTLQICIVRIYVLTSWVHFGSIVISVAMMGLGMAAMVVHVAARRSQVDLPHLSGAALLVLGPSVLACNVGAQRFVFNPIFLTSDWTQAANLAVQLALYSVPFFLGSFFLSAVFLRESRIFSRLYFCDLAGSGVSIATLVAGMYILAPERLLVVPLVLGCGASITWCLALGARKRAALQALLALPIAGLQMVLPGTLVMNVSEFKSVSQARVLADARLMLDDHSPFGRLEAYSSAFFHFAPGLSDNAALNLVEMPRNVYAGLYIDSEGPFGIVRRLSDSEAAYFRYLPAMLPYVVKRPARALIAQFGGGLSTAVAVHAGVPSITVAEPNPRIVHAFEHDPALKEFSGDVLGRTGIRIVNDEARFHAQRSLQHYDLIDFTLGDSVGMVSPGGFPATEKYAYTLQAFIGYLQALKPDGILSVTVWNREEPPAAVLKLFATFVAAARKTLGSHLADHFFVAANYLSTVTVLFKRDGFSDTESEQLRRHATEMSFDVIHAAGSPGAIGEALPVLQRYGRWQDSGSRMPRGDAGRTAEGRELPGGSPPIRLLQAAWASLLGDTWESFANAYVYDVSQLTDDRPYLAGHTRPEQLHLLVTQPSSLQHDWGYLALLISFAIAALLATTLLGIPAAVSGLGLGDPFYGSRATLVYFGAIGIGFMLVEVGLLSMFHVLFPSSTVTLLVVLPGLLIAAGIGSLSAQAVSIEARWRWILAAVVLMVVTYALSAESLLSALGALRLAWRIVATGVLVAPIGFMLGLPMPCAMRLVARGDTGAWVSWVWGVNGLMSVVGATLAPIVATNVGLWHVLALASVAYFLAALSFGPAVLSQPPHGHSSIERAMRKPTMS
jgi:predicted membrane-bound spermidine synthase